MKPLLMFLIPILYGGYIVAMVSTHSWRAELRHRRWIKQRDRRVLRENLK